MSKRYYILDMTNKKDFIEVTEEQWLNLIGKEQIRDYVNQVYSESIAIEDVPMEYQNEVKTIIANRTSKWGEYNSLLITPQEFQYMLEEAF